MSVTFVASRQPGRRGAELPGAGSALSECLLPVTGLAGSPLRSQRGLLSARQERVPPRGVAASVLSDLGMF